MRIHAALYLEHAHPDRPVFLAAWSAEMVAESPSGWRAVLAFEAPAADIAAIAEVVLDIPDGPALAALRAAPPVIPIQPEPVR